MEDTDKEPTTLAELFDETYGSVTQEGQAERERQMLGACLSGAMMNSTHLALFRGGEPSLRYVGGYDDTFSDLEYLYEGAVMSTPEGHQHFVCAVELPDVDISYEGFRFQNPTSILEHSSPDKKAPWLQHYYRMVDVFVSFDGSEAKEPISACLKIHPWSGEVSLVYDESPFEEVNCRYGAPMGRMTIPPEEGEVLTLVRVPLVDGCYDPGGAYWGAPEDLWVGYSDESYVAVRAPDWDAARMALLDEYPGIHFSGKVVVPEEGVKSVEDYIQFYPGTEVTLPNGRRYRFRDTGNTYQHGEYPSGGIVIQSWLPTLGTEWVYIDNSPGRRECLNFLKAAERLAPLPA